MKYYISIIYYVVYTYLQHMYEAIHTWQCCRTEAIEVVNTHTYMQGNI